MTSSVREITPGPIAMAVGPLDSRGLLRPATMADEPFVRALFHADRASQFAGIPEPMLTTLLDQQLRARQIGYRQTFPDADHFIIVSDGRSVGHVISALGDEGGVRVLHVVDIVIAAPARGHGIGTAIFIVLGHVAATLGAASIRLAVLITNVRARQLYERLGFTAASGDGVRITMVRPLS